MKEWNPKWWQRLSVDSQNTINHLAQQPNAVRSNDPKVRARAKAIKREEKA